MKTALILGITGQDGSYLAELLVEKGYAVHGLVRRASMFNRSRIEHLRRCDRVILHYGELHDVTSLRRLLLKLRPDELYHLAGQSHVGLSFEIPEVTCHENGMAVLQVLEALRDLASPPRFFHASSSEIFGAPAQYPQNESTPILPTNPYGCAKAFATQLVRVYRQSYGLFACNGIAYNHESPRRGENFVTRKISAAVARIAAGAPEVLKLGNLDAQRDWGWAPEYVEAMWRMLQTVSASDYILATGTCCTVRDFAASAFEAAGVPVEFVGRGVEEVARRCDTGVITLIVDPAYFRPCDSSTLVGDPSKAGADLGWTSRTVGREVARAMANSEFIGR